MLLNLKRRLPVVALLALLLLIQSTSLQASDDDNPHLLKTRTTSVSVFKNGMGFFTREGTAQKRDGWVMAEQIPPASFGTLAIYSTSPDEWVDIVGTGPGEVIEFNDVDQANDQTTKRKRLAESLNLSIEVAWQDKNESTQTVAGKLVSIGPEYAILTRQANFAVPIEKITRMQILQMPLRIHLQNETANADAETDEAKSTIGIAYLSKGITWIPEYTVRILDDDTAELTLRGTVINEAEDLIHCDINLVVGVPHFAHSDKMAPIAVGQTVRKIAAASSNSMVQSQIMSRAAIVSNQQNADQFAQLDTNAPGVENAVGKSGSTASVTNNLPDMSASGAADFTVYTKKDMTLRTGERAIVTLFKKKISFKHVYRWHAPKRMEHLLRLENNTDSAWTTGPYLALSETQPLSEDLLLYTPRGGVCDISVSSAINIAHDKNEQEVDRDLKAHAVGSKKYYDRVTLEGKLKLRNFEKVPARVLIRIPVEGKPTEASNEGVVSVDARNLKLLERTGVVEWNLTLTPEQQLELTYQYEKYVPSQ